MDVTEFKDRIYKELDELLECEHWDGIKLKWVTQLSQIAHWIAEMEEISGKSNQ